MNIYYKYKDPLKNGYKKVKKEKYKFIIKDYKWYLKYKVYEDGESFLIHQFEPIWSICLMIILIPVLIILDGLWGIKDIFFEIYNCIFQKRRGYFNSYIIWKNELK